jgi:hypothetical protein
MALQDTTQSLEGGRTGSDLLPGIDFLAYEPLPRPDSIRVLSLQAFDNQRPGVVHCTLVVRPIISKDPHDSSYKALSYVWGDENDLESIQVDKRHVTVRSNLYHALLELSKDIDESLLWVDALCIDQANLLERNTQVALMGDIYSNAAQVIVWLGNGLEPDGTMGTMLPDGFTQSRPLSSRDDAESGAESLTVSGLECMGSNHWFQRCWTMQELILARSAIVRCGRHKITWSKLSMLMEEAAKGDPPADLAWTTWLSTDNVLRLQNLLAEFATGHLKLSRLLEESWRRLTSEPIDLIFAVMGLFPAPPITIDYSQPPRKVCTDATVACILRERNLNILTLACLINSDDSDPNADPAAALTDEQLLDPCRTPSWAISIPIRRVFAHTAPFEVPIQSISDRILARIHSEPTLQVLPLTGSILGRFTSGGSPLQGSHGEDLEIMPPCTTFVVNVPQAGAQNSTASSAPDTFSKLSDALRRHDKHTCACAEPQRRPNLVTITLDSSIRLSSRDGDLLALLDGGAIFYQLRLVAEQLKLVGTVGSQRAEVMDTILGTGWQNGLTAASDWPRVQTNVPLS